MWVRSYNTFVFQNEFKDEAILKILDQRFLGSMTWSCNSFGFVKSKILRLEIFNQRMNGKSAEGQLQNVK